MQQKKIILTRENGFTKSFTFTEDIDIEKPIEIRDQYGLIVETFCGSGEKRFSLEKGEYFIRQKIKKNGKILNEFKLDWH